MNTKIVFLLVTFSSVISAEDCVWNKDTEFPEYPPLLIDLDAWVSLKAVRENGDRIVRISEDTTIVVACSGTTIRSLQEEVVEGVCTGGSFLTIGETQYSIEDLACTSRIKDSILEGLGPCGNDDIGELAELGFDVPNYQFYATIRVCFEPKNEIALYSEDMVYGESVSATDGNPDKPYFRDSDYSYPTIDPNECYLTAHQDEFFTELLGDPDFIDLDSNLYFARGHLSPNADFLTDMEADSSYYYINAVPQWQPFNAGNWMYLEIDTRDLAESHSSHLHIFTGPWNQLVLNDVNNNPQEIFICDSQEQSIIPIPDLMWKVIYEPSTDRGLAVITSNNPQNDLPLEPICSDIGCDTITWITHNFTEVDNGYSYCCTVQDFHSVNLNAPNFPTATLLID